MFWECLWRFIFFLEKFFVPSLLSPNIIGKVLSLFCFPCILRRSFVHENGFFIGSENNYVGNNLLETGILQFLFNLRFFDDGDFTKSSYCDWYLFAVCCLLKAFWTLILNSDSLGRITCRERKNKNSIPLHLFALIADVSPKILAEMMVFAFSPCLTSRGLAIWSKRKSICLWTFHTGEVLFNLGVIWYWQKFQRSNWILTNHFLLANKIKNQYGKSNWYSIFLFESQIRDWFNSLDKHH